MPRCLALFVVNKSGGLIYHRDFSPGGVRLDTNDTLRVASIWHSLHAISSQVRGCLRRREPAAAPPPTPRPPPLAAPPGPPAPLPAPRPPAFAIH